MMVCASGFKPTVCLDLSRSGQPAVRKWFQGDYVPCVFPKHLDTETKTGDFTGNRAATLLEAVELGPWNNTGLRQFATSSASIGPNYVGMRSVLVYTCVLLGCRLPAILSNGRCMSEIVETYRACDIHRDSTTVKTGSGVKTISRYCTVATKSGGNQKSLRAGTLFELKHMIDPFLDLDTP